MIEWEGICSLAACAGVITNFIRFGKWQGSIETKVSILEKESQTAITKFDVIGSRLEDTSKLLAELNAKLEILLKEHYEK